MPYEDQLGRREFAKSLALSMLAHKQQDCLLIGLHGAEGSGKTFLLSLISAELADAEKYSAPKEKPLVWHFDPYFFSEQDNLELKFLQQFKQHCPKIAQELEKYSQNITPENKDILIPLLKQLSYKIIIIIDNSDKLMPHRLEKLVHITRALADFPNIIYLFALDLHKNNREYQLLKQNMDINFAVPSLTKQELINLIFNSLHNIKTQDSWQRLDNEGFKQLFHSSNAAEHYLKSVAFVHEWLKQEVDFVDLCALTALQIFMPQLYNDIRQNCDLFTDIMQLSYPDSGAYLEEEKKRCDAILTRNTANHLLSFLSEIFPKLSFLYFNKQYTKEDQQEWRRLHRACDPDSFMRFFILSLTQDKMPMAEIESIIASIKNNAVFNQTIKSLIQDQRINSFFTLFSDYIPERVTQDNVTTLITTLCDCGDLIPNSASRIHHIITRLLEKTKQHLQVLQTALKNTNMSIYTAIYEIENNKILNSNEIEKLQTIMLTHIEEWQRQNRLIEHPNLPEILFAWQKWGKKPKNSPFITALIATDKNLLKFILAFLRPAVNTFRTELKRKQEWQFYLKQIDNLIERNKIEPRIGKIFSDSGMFNSLTEPEQVAILIFLDKT